jgi:hypothetical protein
MNAPTSIHEMKIMNQLPDMGSGPVPIEPYISPEYFEKEKRKYSNAPGSTSAA